MSWSRSQTIGTSADAGAALLFAGAAGFACLSIAGSTRLSAAIALAAFYGCFKLLRRIEAEPRDFMIANFTAAPMPIEAVAELILTHAQMLKPESATGDLNDELLLDDILAGIAPDSRVVRLFDAAAMPTPGQLRERIDRHLDQGKRPTAPPDASQDLYEALAELRRSLR